MSFTESLDRRFKASERGSSISTEIMGGLTTFLAMAYIIAVNPAILSTAGIPFNAALTATCFGAAIMTLAMGLIVNRPLALASGMGINAIVAFTLCAGLQVDWRVAMSIIFLEGILILILVVCGLRESVMRAIPVEIRRAIGIGIGLFIALIGLKGGGIVVSDPTTYITMGDVTTPKTIVALISIVVAVLLTARGMKSAFLISIAVATIIGIPLGVTEIPHEFNFAPDFSTIGAPFQQTEHGTMAMVELFTMPILLVFVFSLMMSDFFDTMGVVVAVGNQANFTDKDGEVKNCRGILTIDSIAAIWGGFTGASSITTYLESSAGASAGARTGLSSVVIGILFILCSFLAPLIGLVSASATCGALVVVGFLMMTDIANISWNDPAIGFASFITIATIPMTYSITNGIGFGFISYVLIRVVQGRIREIHPLMWVIAILFGVSFIAIH